MTKKKPMHKTLIFILILCCHGLFFNCKKEDDAKNENYTDLQDKMIKIPDGLIIGSTNFDLDIDKDNTIDLSILIVKDYSSMHSWANYVQISAKNGYELCYSNYVDTSGIGIRPYLPRYFNMENL